MAFYLCHTPRPVSLQHLVQVAGARWTIEECFQTGKNEAAFDHYQVRLYPAWYRYITPAMLALADGGQLDGRLITCGFDTEPIVQRDRADDVRTSSIQG
nr:hypothetical protein [Nonomuraea sp. SYSU D8015]